MLRLRLSQMVAVDIARILRSATKIDDEGAFHALSLSKI